MAVVYGSFVTGTEALTVQNSFNYQFRLYLDYSYTQDIEKNQTTITSKIYLQKISNELTTYVFFPGTFTKAIGDSTENFTTQTSIAGSYIAQISSKTRTYTHDNEGKLGNVLLSAKYNGYGPTQTGTYQPQCSVSTTIKIPDIPRASKITSNVNTIDIGSTVKLTIGELNVATYSLKLFYSLNGATEVEVGSVNSGSYDFTVPTSLLQQLPSSTSGTLSMILKTYSGSTLIGSNIVNITVNVSQSVKPTVSLSLEDVGNVPKEWGFWVQGKSRPKGTITATAGEGSSLTDNSYYSTINSNKYYTNPFTATGVLSKAGTTTIISQVTDRRGRTNSTTKNIEVVAYSSPQLISPKVVRCDADGNEQANGTYAKVTFYYKISPLNNKNAGSTIIYWKTKNETSFENSKTLGLSNYEGSQTIVISDYNFLVSNIYDFEVTINDYYTTTKQSLFLKAVKKPQSFRPKGKGVAFNKYATDDGVFEIDEWDLIVNAKAKISENVQVGTLESKNLFNKYDEVGRYYSNYQITENYIRAITELTGQNYSTSISYVLDFEKYKGKTITLSGSWKSNGTVVGAIGIAYLNEAGGIPAWLIPSNTHGTEGKMAESALVPDTMPQIATKIALILYSNAGGASTTGDYVDYYDVQIEEGETKTIFTPHKKYGYNEQNIIPSLEIITNETYNDKPIYRLRKIVGNCPNNTKLAYNTGLKEEYPIVDYKLFATRNNQVLNIPFVALNLSDMIAGYLDNANLISCASNWDASSFYLWIDILYIKN